MAGSLGLVYPGLLYGFEYAFAAALVVIIELFKSDHIVMQVDKAYGFGVDIGILVAERLGDLLYISPFH